MARNINIPLQNRAAGIYGPFTIDGKKAGDNGATISIARSNDGVWPLTEVDPVLNIVIDGLYSGVWLQLSSSTFFGGTQQLPRNAGVKLTEFVNLTWPKKSDGAGGLIPDPPDSVRMTATLAIALNTGMTVQWL